MNDMNKKIVDPKSMKITGFFWILEGIIVIAILVAKFVFHLF